MNWLLRKRSGKLSLGVGLAIVFVWYLWIIPLFNDPSIPFIQEIYDPKDVEAYSIKREDLQYYGHRTTNTGWYVYTKCLQRRPIIIYGFGCGEDVSWDTSMIDNFQAQAYLFDPTPKSIKLTTRVAEKYGPSKMVFTPEGIAAEPGELEFEVPSEHVSMRPAEGGIQHLGSNNFLTLKVDTLKNFMKRFGHEYIDVLKLDVEGSELGVLANMIDEGFLPATQLLVEFHQRFFEKKDLFYYVIAGLKRRGFQLYYVSSDYKEFNFIKIEDLDYCRGISDSRNAYTNLQAV